MKIKKERKAGILSGLPRTTNSLVRGLEEKYNELLENFNKLVETVRTETVEKQRAKEELYFLQEYSRHIIDSAAEGIVTCDLEYYLKSFSPAAEKLLAYRSEEIIGTELGKFFEKPEDFASLQALLEKDGCAKNFETTLINKNSKAIPVILSFSLLKIQDKNPMGLVGVIRDLKEIKVLQTQLFQAGKLAAIGQLAAGIAHEINNPLTTVSGHIQLLLSEAKDSETKTTLKLINSEIDRCKDITQGLLSFSQESKEKKFEEINLNECLRRALFILKYKLTLLNIRLVMRLARNLPGVYGNANQLQQVFMNLVLNAIDAMPNGGTLSISTKTLNNDFVKVVFSDTGTGIAEDDLVRIFEPFYTTKEPGRGVGLGLSISYGIIKEHGGEILVQSRKGKTTFTLKLPRA